jgi:hypothetical protein
MQSIKEKKLLVKFALQFGQPIDPKIVEEVRKYDEIQKAAADSIRASAAEDLREFLSSVPEDAGNSKAPVTIYEREKQPEPAPVVEAPKEKEVVAEAVPLTPAPKGDILSAAAITPSQATPKRGDSYQQPVAPEPKDIKEIKRKIKFLEQWLSKISLTGPGGGGGGGYDGAQGVQGTTGSQGASGPQGIQGPAGSGNGSANLTVGVIYADSSLGNTYSNISILRFDDDSGFDVTQLNPGEVKVAMNSTFKTWVVQGSANLVAQGLDTVEFIAGNNISITTDANSNPKSITFSAIYNLLSNNS